MKAQEIVLSLGARLPLFTDRFTSNSDVVSIINTGGLASITTSTPHGRVVGDAISIVGALSPVGISSFTRTGSIGYIETSADHDITTGVPTHAIVYGANEVEFNGEFLITSVSNRRNFTVLMEDSGPTSATGSPELGNGLPYFKQYNGIHAVTSVVSPVELIISVDPTLPNPLGDIKLRSRVRVSASATLERLLESYTEQPQDDLWLFVVLDDVVASKDRNIIADAVSNTQRSSYLRQQLVQDVSLYLFIPTSDEIAGRKARDLAEEMFRPICRSILFKKFDSNLYVGKQSPLQFISHGMQAYNSAYYVHRYSFQQVYDLSFQDSYGYDQDVAFRDISLDIGTTLGAGKILSDIDLDDEPLTP